MANVTRKQVLVTLFVVQVLILAMYIHRERLLGAVVTVRNLPFRQQFTTDTHYEDTDLGHTWINNDHMTTRDILPNSVAIGMGLTSRGSDWSTIDKLKTSFPIFKHFMPTFCKTASNGYKYHFFIAFDRNDKFFTVSKNVELFVSIFQEELKLCPPKSTYDLHFVHCSHNGLPAHAQNDAMIEAYMSNMEYFYRVNDDSILKTPGWTELFIETLNSFIPPGVGVVGPKHRGGNVGILTYDFVSYRHIDIHGVYYPRIFTGWYADNWITFIYRPDRCVKHNGVQLDHTIERSTRYHVKTSMRKDLPAYIESGQRLINKYVSMYDNKVPKNSSMVIGMYLDTIHPRYTYGAVRNAQLMKVYFPGWKLRVYIPSAVNSSEVIPVQIINKLITLGVDIKRIIVKDNLPSWTWKYNAIDDVTVKYFLIRNSASRVNERLFDITQEFINLSGKYSMFSVIDTQSNTKVLSEPFVGGLTMQLKRKISKITEFIKNFVTSNQTETYFINDVLIPKLNSSVIIYDSIHNSNNTVKYPPAGKEFHKAPTGVLYDQNEIMLSIK